MTPYQNENRSIQHMGQVTKSLKVMLMSLKKATDWFRIIWALTFMNLRVCGGSIKWTPTNPVYLQAWASLMYRHSGWHSVSPLGPHLPSIPYCGSPINTLLTMMSLPASLQYLTFNALASTSFITLKIPHFPPHSAISSATFLSLFTDPLLLPPTSLHLPKVPSNGLSTCFWLLCMCFVSRVPSSLPHLHLCTSSFLFTFQNLSIPRKSFYNSLPHLSKAFSFAFMPAFFPCILIQCFHLVPSCTDLLFSSPLLSPFHSTTLLPFSAFSSCFCQRHYVLSPWII